MKQKRVLIVDDEPNVALVLSACLEKLGPDYICEVAHGGDEALAKLRQTPYALLLTDYNMPGMTGAELAQEVHRVSPKTQVILMTAYGNENLRRAIGPLQFDGYIDKPFTADAIREIVKRTIAKTQAAKTAPVSPQTDKHKDNQLSIEQHLKYLRSHTGARCVLLLSANGFALNVVGQTAKVDINTVGALIAGNFMAAAELAKMLGGRSVFKSSYHEGDDYNIYAYKVNDELLLAIIFGSESKPGVVWFYTKQIAAALAPLVPTQTPKLILSDNLNTMLEAEFGDLLDSEPAHKPMVVQSTPANNSPSKSMSFEEAVAAGLVPAQLMQREKKEKGGKQ